MAYEDQAGMSPAAEGLEAGGSDMPGEMGMEHEGTAPLPKSVLGGKSFNVGDEIVLEVTGVTDDGITVKYASAEGDKPPESESWEDSFRKEMSPQSPREEAS